MSIELSGFKMVVNLYDFIAGLSGEDRAKVIDALACQDEVIDEVVNQIIDGFTTQGSHAATSYGGYADATRGLDGARMRIAKASSEIAEKEIAALARQIEAERELGRKGWNAYHDLLDPSRDYAA